VPCQSGGSVRSMASASCATASSSLCAMLPPTAGSTGSWCRLLTLATGSERLQPPISEVVGRPWSLARLLGTLGGLRAKWELPARGPACVPTAAGTGPHPACLNLRAPPGAAAIRSVFAQPTGPGVRAHVEVVAGMLEQQFPAVAATLRDAREDLTAFADFPESHWRKIWSTNPLSVIRPRDGALDLVA
jgi:hypothetical protein